MLGGLERFSKVFEGLREFIKYTESLIQNQYYWSITDNCVCLELLDEKYCLALEEFASYESQHKQSWLRWSRLSANQTIHTTDS